MNSPNWDMTSRPSNDGIGGASSDCDSNILNGMRPENSPILTTMVAILGGHISTYAADWVAPRQGCPVQSQNSCNCMRIMRTNYSDVGSGIYEHLDSNRFGVRAEFQIYVQEWNLRVV